jgi:hypothetical protein
VLADGVKQMGLAQAEPTMKENWIVRLARSFGDSFGGGAGEAVLVANNE